MRQTSSSLLLFLCVFLLPLPSSTSGVNVSVSQLSDVNCRITEARKGAYKGLLGPLFLNGGNVYEKTSDTVDFSSISYYSGLSNAPSSNTGTAILHDLETNIIYTLADGYGVPISSANPNEARNLLQLVDTTGVPSAMFPLNPPFMVDNFLIPGSIFIANGVGQALLRNADQSLVDKCHLINFSTKMVTEIGCKAGSCQFATCSSSPFTRGILEYTPTADYRVDHWSPNFDTLRVCDIINGIDIAGFAIPFSKRPISTCVFDISLASGQGQYFFNVDDGNTLEITAGIPQWVLKAGVCGSTDSSSLVVTQNGLEFKINNINPTPLSCMETVAFGGTSTNTVFTNKNRVYAYGPTGQFSAPVTDLSADLKTAIRTQVGYYPAAIVTDYETGIVWCLASLSLDCITDTSTPIKTLVPLKTNSNNLDPDRTGAIMIQLSPGYEAGIQLTSTPILILSSKGYFAVVHSSQSSFAICTFTGILTTATTVAFPFAPSCLAYPSPFIHGVLTLEPMDYGFLFPSGLGLTKVLASTGTQSINYMLTGVFAPVCSFTFDSETLNRWVFHLEDGTVGYSSLTMDSNPFFFEITIDTSPSSTTVATSITGDLQGPLISFHSPGPSLVALQGKSNWMKRISDLTTYSLTPKALSDVIITDLQYDTSYILLDSSQSPITQGSADIKFLQPFNPENFNEYLGASISLSTPISLTGSACDTVFLNGYGKFGVLTMMPPSFLVVSLDGMVDNTNTFSLLNLLLPRCCPLINPSGTWPMGVLEETGDTPYAAVYALDAPTSYNDKLNRYLFLSDSNEDVPFTSPIFSLLRPGPICSFLVSHLQSKWWFSYVPTSPPSWFFQGGELLATCDAAIDVIGVTTSSSITLSSSPSISITTTSSTTLSASSTLTPTRSLSASNSITASVTITPTRSLSSSISLSASNSLTPTPSLTPTRSLSSSSSLSASNSLTPTRSLSSSGSLSTSSSLTPATSLTSSSSLTPTTSLSGSTSLTASISITRTTSLSGSTSLTASVSLPPTTSISSSSSFTPTGSITPSNSITPTGSLTPSSNSPPVSNSPTESLSATSSVSLTSSGTLTPTVTVTRSVSQTPSSSAGSSNTGSSTPTSQASISTGASPSTSVSFTPSLSVTLTGSLTASNSLTASLSLSTSSTTTTSISLSKTPTFSVSISPSSSLSLTPTISTSAATSLSNTATPSFTPPSSNTPSNSLTGSSSGSPGGSNTPSVSISNAGSATVTPTPPGTISASPSLTPSSSLTPTNTLSTTTSQSVGYSLSRSPTLSATSSLTLTSTNTPTSTGSGSNSNTPSASIGTGSPSTSKTLSPSVIPTSSPSESPSAILSSSNSASVSTSSTETLTPSLSASQVSSSNGPSISGTSSPSTSLLTVLSQTSFPSTSIPPSVSNLPVVPSGSPDSSISASASISRDEFIPPSVSIPATSTPTPTKSSTPTPTSAPGDPEQITDEDGEEIDLIICSDPALPYGCEGKCVNSLSLCTEDGQEACTNPNDCPSQPIPDSDDGGTDIIGVDLVIENSKKEVKVPIVGKDGSFVGSIKIPPGTFEKGTIIQIGTFKGTLPEDEDKDKKKKCGDDDSDSGGTEEKTTRVSGLYQIKAFQPSGKTPKLNRPVILAHYVVLPDGVSPRDTCMAFNQGEKDSKWTCDNKAVSYKRIDKENNTYLVTQEFDHFTGFSVLLGDTSGGGGVGCISFSTIQWLSVAFLIGAAVVVSFICIVYYFTRRAKRQRVMSRLTKMGTQHTSMTSINRSG